MQDNFEIRSDHKKKRKKKAESNTWLARRESSVGFVLHAQKNNHSCLTLLAISGFAVDPGLVGARMGPEELTCILPGLVGL